jgi:hypothetical protein
VKEKKIKKEIIKVSSTGIKNNKKKKKKDKHRKSDLDSEQKNSSFEISDCENNQRTILNESVDSSIEKPIDIMPSDDVKKDSNIEINNEDSTVKKKRKRNKGKKVKLEANISSPGLRIMSKYKNIFLSTF